MAVSDYNVEPGLNVSISGINIAEGCAPSGINDAIRQLMADVKAESDALANTLSEQSAAQAEIDDEQNSAIAAIKATADAALPKAGGEMTGAITAAGDESDYLALRSRSDRRLIVAGGSSTEQGASLVLHGVESSEGGSFRLTATDGTASRALAGSPDGALQWDGRRLLTEEGGIVGPLKMAGAVSASTDGSCLLLGGSGDAASGAQLCLYGHGHAQSPGLVRMVAKSSEDEHDVSLKPDGEFLLDGKPLIALTDEWHSGASWYRRYSDGWIEQSGRATIDLNNEVITLHLPFTDTNYTVAVTSYSTTSTDLGGYDHAPWLSDFTTTTFRLSKSVDCTEIWYACGY